MNWMAWGACALHCVRHADASALGICITLCVYVSADGVATVSSTLRDYAMPDMDQCIL